MNKGIERSIMFVFCLVLMSSFVLGQTAGITGVQITPITSPNVNYAMINVKVLISETYPDQINNLIFNYRLPGNAPGSYNINSVLIPDSRQVSFSYPNPQNGINFDYQVQGFNNVGDVPYIYYPSSTAWNTYSSTGSSTTTSSPNTTNNQAITQVNTTPLNNNQVTNVNNQSPATNNTQTTPITGAAATNTSNSNSGAFLNFAKTIPGTIIIIFIAIVLLIIIVRVARGKKKTQNTAEVIVSKPE